MKKKLDDLAKKAESISAAMQKKSENEESEEKSDEKGQPILLQYIWI